LAQGLLRDVYGGAGLLDALGAAAIGQKAKVPNAHEALGQDVEQEAAEQLFAREGQDLVAVAVA